MAFPLSLPSPVTLRLQFYSRGTGLNKGHSKGKNEKVFHKLLPNTRRKWFSTNPYQIPGESVTRWTLTKQDLASHRAGASPELQGAPAALLTADCQESGHSQGTQTECIKERWQ